MRKKFALLLVFQIAFLFFSEIHAQVYNGDLVLSTQAQVDAFNYTEVDGDLTISGFDITNLDGLSELTKVTQKLFIKNNASLTNVNGLHNLKEVEVVMYIENNDALTNLDGLSAFKTAYGIVIFGNLVLSNIDGLSHLEQLSFSGIRVEDNRALVTISLPALELVFGSLVIENNPALTSIEFLTLKKVGDIFEVAVNHALTTLNCPKLTETSDGLFLRTNPKLASIDGLSALETIGYLAITGCFMLTNIDALSNVTTIVGVSIGVNANLVNIDGLSGISEIHDQLHIAENSSLENINGVSNVKLIHGDVNISNNFNLANINGLAKVEEMYKSLTIRGNRLIINVDGLSKLTKLGTDLTITSNIGLVDFCGLYPLFHSGTIGGTISITNNGARTVELIPPQNITVNADPGLCSATLLAAAIGTATPVGCLEDFSVVISDAPPGNVYPVGTTQITWQVTDGAGNTAIAKQLVTVVDNQHPVITCPANITVSCASDVPPADITKVTATDNCSATVEHVSDVVSDSTCVNRFKLTRTYKATDPAGNSSTCAQIITVYDNVPPQLSEVTPSQTSLWPPNHTMRDILLTYTVSDNCVINPNTIVTIQSSEAVNGTGDGDTAPDWEVVDAHHIRLRAERAANGNGRVYLITVTVNDGCNPAVIKTTQVMVSHNITDPPPGHPFKIGSTVSFAGEFWDIPSKKHTAKWLIDNNTSVKGIITEPAGAKNGKATGSYKFTNAGVYRLQMNIIDQYGITSYANTNGDVDAIVVIYDPNGGYTYGGGWFNSPAGALQSDASATGKASYGFTVNYFKNSTNPKGETQFEFKVGNFEFNALNYDYLVIDGAKAQFRGTGKVNGDQSGYAFTMTVIDGALDGSNIDKVRMKIYNKNTGQIIYDNQPGADDTINPTNSVGSNSSIVISGNVPPNNQAANRQADLVIESVQAFDSKVTPNPSSNYFKVSVTSKDTKTPVTIRVIDIYGRIMEERKLPANTVINLGGRYVVGTYIVQVRQGKEQREIKLVKL